KATGLGASLTTPVSAQLLRSECGTAVRRRKRLTSAQGGAKRAHVPRSRARASSGVEWGVFGRYLPFEHMPAAARLILKRGREKSLRRRHPWIFSGAVERLEGSAEPGATVDVVGADGERLASAAYSPRSQIRARVWT